VLQEEEYQHHSSGEEETHLHQIEGKEREERQINIWLNKKTSCINANESSSTCLTSFLEFGSNKHMVV
jgi:hypothetical protein